MRNKAKECTVESVEIEAVCQTGVLVKLLELPEPLDFCWLEKINALE